MSMHDEAERRVNALGMATNERARPMRPQYTCLIIVLTSLLIACGGTSNGAECGEAVADQLDGVYDEWVDALELAGSTSRIALGERVADLQRIRREVKSQDWPECASRAQRLLVQAMDHSIEAFQLFMQDKSDAVVADEFEDATEYMQRFRDELEAMQED